MTVTRSVVPGAWYGVLGDSVLVLLPPAAKSRVAAVWERVDDDAGFDEVLDSLISGGLRELPEFVLVSTEGSDGDAAREVKVVIRGAGEAVLTTGEGPVTVTGSAGSTWVERSASGVIGLRVSVGDDAAGGDHAAYALATGLVRLSSVEQPSREAGLPAPAAPEPAAAPVPPVPEPQSVPEPTPEPEPPASPVVPVAPVPGAPVPVPAPMNAPAVPPPTPEPTPEPEPVVEDADTQTGLPAPAHRAAAPDEEPAPPASRPVARLLFSSGEVVEVDRAIVIGRSPEARRFGDDQARLVPVPSPHQEISSTHLEIRPGSGADHGSAVATDLGSTNGTVVVQPGLPAEDLQPGIAVALVPGAIVDLGEGVTIQVTGV